VIALMHLVLSEKVARSIGTKRQQTT
jgi:hypothetical protein